MVGMLVDDNPELDTVVLHLPEHGIEILKFIEYTYEENFFTPSDAWHFKIAGDSIPEKIDDALVPGTKVQLVINGNIQSTGRISTIDRRGSRDSGTEIDITGYDLFGPLVDAHVDPNLRFNEGQTLFDVVASVFNSFGIDSFSSDNNANLNVITGQKKGAPAKRRALKAFTTHQLKPYEREGALAFVGRILNRFGLWSWPDAKGETAIIGKVDGLDDDGKYTLPAVRYQLRRKRGEQTNNIIAGGIVRDAKDQPSVILARGIGGGGEFASAALRSAMVNPAISTNLAAIDKQYPKLKFQALDVPGIESYLDPHARPLYLKDDESHTQEQLDAFVRREMSLLLRKHLVGHYVIKGHSIGGSPVAVDSIVDVDDDHGKYHGPMWIEGRSFTKAAGQTGSTSTLTTCVPGTVIL